MGFCSKFLLILITIFFPPIGVGIVAGCGSDLLINICLTVLGYIPGHIHAFYVEYIYFTRKDAARTGTLRADRAPGVFSDRVQRGGATQVAPAPAPGYGTMPPH